MAWACLILTLLAAPDGFTEAPAYVPLFTPRAVKPGTYRVYTSAHQLDAVLEALRLDSSIPMSNGSFEPMAAAPADAFGQSGSYNRWTLAMLYGGKPPRVARGPRLENGRVVEAWTLVSPYPDTALEHLNPGTLLIVMHVQP